ncbi:MAG: hypothetical protein ACFFG0_03355 [Candidatus Thorarchaeota archaeon]
MFSKIKRNFLKRKRRNENFCFYLSYALLIIFILIIFFFSGKIFAGDGKYTEENKYINRLFRTATGRNENFHVKVQNIKDINFWLKVEDCYNQKEAYIWYLKQSEYPTPFLFDEFIETTKHFLYYDKDKKCLKENKKNEIELIIHRYYYLFEDKKYFVKEETILGGNNENNLLSFINNPNLQKFIGDTNKQGFKL